MYTFVHVHIYSCKHLTNKCLPQELKTNILYCHTIRKQKLTTVYFLKRYSFVYNKIHSFLKTQSHVIGKTCHDSHPPVPRYTGRGPADVLRHPPVHWCSGRGPADVLRSGNGFRSILQHR